LVISPAEPIYQKAILDGIETRFAGLDWIDAD
jgi:hypothetical protein